ncbi:MAG: hypothetical protein WBW33_13675 [Bryobacteraceae bacterium]
MRKFSGRIVGLAAYAGVVWNWWRRQEAARQQTPLHGAPVRPRLKTYSGATGYVFQYVYRGHRSGQAGRGGAATEYVFSVSRDRKTYFPVSVLLAEPVVAAWSESHQRTLSSTELYAIAKLSLFEAFDERENIEEFSVPVEADAAAIDRHLGALGRL